LFFGKKNLTNQLISSVYRDWLSIKLINLKSLELYLNIEMDYILWKSTTSNSDRFNNSGWSNWHNSKKAQSLIITPRWKELEVEILLVSLKVKTRKTTNRLLSKSYKVLNLLLPRDRSSKDKQACFVSAITRTLLNL